MAQTDSPYPRLMEDQLAKALEPGKVVVLVGARRTGKSVLLKKLIASSGLAAYEMLGEDLRVQELLQVRSVEHYRQLFQATDLLAIDEAQAVPHIGQILKLIVDNLPHLRIIITGSSAFDMARYTGEPLTGRQKTFRLFPMAESELRPMERPESWRDRLEQRLVLGNYPEVVRKTTWQEKAEYLKELVNSYLLKDILAFEQVQHADRLLQLLRLVAFQVGQPVSVNELGRQMAMSKNTVERYLDLLTKVFVLYRVGGFSRNLRKEVVKSAKWYFLDNGILNTILANTNPLIQREDVGRLWENYMVSERLKAQSYGRMLVNNYFWRTYDQQEIDWVEERGGKLYGFEMKWKPQLQKAPIAWAKAYPEAHFEVIHRENYVDWITPAAN